MSETNAVPLEKKKLAEQADLTVDQWRAIALHLFGLLDNIDTVSDMAKGDQQAYGRLVESQLKRRWDVANTDGYGVVFFPNIKSTIIKN